MTRSKASSSYNADISCCTKRQLVKDNINTAVICMRGSAFSNKPKILGVGGGRGG